MSKSSTPAKAKILVHETRRIKPRIQQRVQTWIVNRLEQSRLVAKTLFLISRGKASVALPALISHDRKWILCRPRGGLNDSLCQVYRCLKYARVSGRTLIIDGSRSGIRDNFSGYFRVASKQSRIILEVPDKLYCHLNQLTCYPPEAYGKLADLQSSFDESRNFIDHATGAALTFNDTELYSESLIYHEQCGGGSLGWKTLRELKLSDELQDSILKRLQILPKQYVAIHIRHSDIKITYREFLSEAKLYFDGFPVLVCTDSLEVLKYAKAALRPSKLFCLAEPPDTNGLPLHDREGFTNRKINIDLLTDLFGLALSSKILHPSTMCGQPSGFTTLAISLMHRPWLIKQLLSRMPAQLTL